MAPTTPSLFFSFTLNRTAPTLVLSHPSSASNFLKLSSRVELIPYGTHSMQRIHFWKPEDKKIPRGLLFFVHGGAWGSGHAWMYRLLALPFLDLGMAVAIVGYRNYPDANAAEQVADLNRAANELLRCKSDLIERIRHKSSSLGVCLAGHSSGAHIALWMLVDRVNHAGMEMSKGSKTTIKAEKLVFDSFIGLSGVYNIDDHFDYEASRGVEELSPMKPACGMTRDNFKSSSPGIRLARTLSVMEHNRNKNLPCVDQYMPRMLLLHGMKDTTVPFSSTAECARMLRSCGVTRYSEQYLGNADHGQTVLDLMRGGQTLDCVKSFLQDCESNPLIIKSKL